VVPGRVSKTTPPTPPWAPPVLRTSLWATSRSPPPPDDALHAIPLWPTTCRHGARAMVSFPSLHCPKSDPRAAGVHLDHIPHPLSPSVTGISRHHRRPCASGQGSPASLFSPWATSPARSWAGQFRPLVNRKIYSFPRNFSVNQFKIQTLKFNWNLFEPWIWSNQLWSLYLNILFRIKI
jgi:hypothetical protein